MEATATGTPLSITSDSGSPIRPTKFLFVVETHFSPLASIPMCPPKQGPQVGAEIIAPASINIFINPSFKASA